jgi:uncharacterized protein (TIGR00251 family)
VRLRVRVIPRAHRDELAGERDGALLVRITAPPVDGKANAAVCAFVARAAGLPKSRVAVVRGTSSRDKTLELAGVEDEAAVRRALGLPA